MVAFWLLWSFAFVLMLWAVSPGRTLQDALAAELLQSHLAGATSSAIRRSMNGCCGGRGPLSYLVLRYSLIAATGILFYFALLRMVASMRLAAAFSLSLVLFHWLADRATAAVDMASAAR